jgi:hypothetical protein
MRGRFVAKTSAMPPLPGARAIGVILDRVRAGVPLVALL